MTTVSNQTEEITVTVNNKQGLHARPADLFVRCANKFESSIDIYNLSNGDSKKANAKSILGILSIGVRSGESLRIVATGTDCKEAVAALTHLIESDFGE